MDRRTRDTFVSPTTVDLTTGNSCWETPPAIFEKLQAEFGPFDLDLTADAQRHLLPKWLGPGSAHDEDALHANWWIYGSSGYSNPPYGPFAAAMIARAAIMTEKGFETTLLLPLRVTRAFRRHVLHGASQLLFCDRRITFYENGAPRWNQKKLRQGWLTPDPAIFDSIVVRYVPGQTVLQVGLWHVPDHAPRPRRLEAGERAAFLQTPDAQTLETPRAHV